MLQALRTTVTTWPFVLSVFTLIANDTWLKRAWPGLVSGKLSDFAGIAVVSLLLLAASGKHRAWVYGAIALVFGWWKSPASQPVIDAINTVSTMPIGRTVDCTDWIALVVMPICARVAARPQAFAIPHPAVRRLILGPVITLTVLGLMATSAMPTRQGYQVRSVKPAADWDLAGIADTVAQVATAQGLSCEDCADRLQRASFRGKGLTLRYTVTGRRAISFEVEALPDGLFFGSDGQEKADRLREQLKSTLASSYKDLEYVEPLKSR